jgi:hypothetical protein
MMAVKTAAALLLAAAAARAGALEFICSTGGVRMHAEADGEPAQSAAATGRRFATAGVTPRTRISRYDLEQAYSGQPVLMGTTWLMVYTLPADQPLARDAMADLGVSPSAAERMARSTGLVDRGIRLAKNADDMAHKVASSHPAAGYAAYIPGLASVRPCF